MFTSRRAAFVRRSPNKKGAEIDPAPPSLTPEMSIVPAHWASVITFLLAGAATALVQLALHPL